MCVFICGFYFIYGIKWHLGQVCIRKIHKTCKHTCRLLLTSYITVADVNSMLNADHINSLTSCKTNAMQPGMFKSTLNRALNFFFVVLCRGLIHTFNPLVLNF